MYQKALSNFSYNSVSDKIVPYFYGLGYSNKKEVYARYTKGSAGVFKVNEVDKISDDRKFEIECRSASDVLKTIIDKHYGRERIIIKSDCEGAEYDILNSLEKSSILSEIDSIVMEWHLGKRETIESTMKRNGFTYVIKTDYGRNFGKCWAFNSKTS